MRRYRRLVLIDRLIPFLAAIVGMVALAGAVAVQVNTDAKTAAVAAAIAELRGSIDAVNQRADAIAATDNGDEAANLAALQDRLSKLETEWGEQKTALAATPVAAPAAQVTDAAATQTAAATIDPKLPTTDCIPLGTRFMVTPNESFPMCQSKAVVKTGAITNDTVYVEGAGPIVETSFGTLPGTSCSIMVFSADESGFGEVRVTCT